MVPAGENELDPAVNALHTMVAAAFIPGIRYDSTAALVGAALLLGILNAFVREVVVPKGKLRTPVAVQRYMNVRIMLPTTPELFFPLHTGLLYGHGVASRSLWMPFVDVTADEDKTRSMQIVPIKKSRELTKYAIEKRLSMAQMTEVLTVFTGLY